MLNNNIYSHTLLLKTKYKSKFNRMHYQYLVYFMYALLLIALYEINTNTFTNKLVNYSESKSYLRRGLLNMEKLNETDYKLNLDDTKDEILFSDDELRVYKSSPSVNKILGIIDIMTKTYFPNLRSFKKTTDDDYEYDDYLFDDELLAEVKDEKLNP